MTNSTSCFKWSKKPMKNKNYFTNWKEIINEKKKKKFKKQKEFHCRWNQWCQILMIGFNIVLSIQKSAILNPKINTPIKVKWFSKLFFFFLLLNFAVITYIFWSEICQLKCIWIKSKPILSPRTTTIQFFAQKSFLKIFWLFKGCCISLWWIIRRCWQFWWMSPFLKFNYLVFFWSK